MTIIEAAELANFELIPRDLKDLARACSIAVPVAKLIILPKIWTNLAWDIFLPIRKDIFLYKNLGAVFLSQTVPYLAANFAIKPAAALVCIPPRTVVFTGVVSWTSVTILLIISFCSSSVRSVSSSSVSTSGTTTSSLKIISWIYVSKSP